VYRASWVRRGLAAALLLLPMPLACTNNPFNPRAELVVTKVEPPTGMPTTFTGMVGIALDQTKPQEPLFLYADPTVTIQNGPKQPESYLTEAIIEATIGQTKLPTKRFPITIAVPKGGTVTAIVPFLRGDPDYRNAAFPNQTANAIEGMALVTLMGKDRNGNEVSAGFSTALSFTTLNIPAPIATPTPAPLPTSGPTAVPTAVPAPVGP
jgi:hypothetical protein